MQKFARIDGNHKTREMLVNRSKKQTHVFLTEGYIKKIPENNTRGVCDDNFFYYTKYISELSKDTKYHVTEKTLFY